MMNNQYVENLVQKQRYEAVRREAEQWGLAQEVEPLNHEADNLLRQVIAGLSHRLFHMSRPSSMRSQAHKRQRTEPAGLTHLPTQPPTIKPNH